MAAFITDIIDSVTDDKKINMCLVQHRRYEKSHSAVPKTECRAMIHRVSLSRRLATSYFSYHSGKTQS